MIVFQMILRRTRTNMALLRTWRWKLLLLIVVLSGTSVCRQASEQNRSPTKTPADGSLEHHLGKGYEALKQEQYLIAEKEFRAALAIDPKLVMRARFPLAVALFEQHKSAESRREFGAVRRAVGDQPGILYYLGRLDLEDRNYKGAIEFLNKASLRPPFPDTAFYLGVAYLKQGSSSDAEKWLKKAAEMDPDDSRAEYELATLYRKEGRQEEADQAFQRSRAKKAGSDKQSQLKFECGKELDRGLSEKATEICDQLYDPNDAEKLAALGILYGQHGHLEMALKPLQRAAELAPQSPQMQYNLAFTYFQMKRFQEARGPLEGAVERWPDLFPLNALYGAVLWNLGEVPAAYQALQHAHQLNPQDGNTTILLYQAALELARRSEETEAHSVALRYLQEATSLAPTAPEPHQRMAVIYQRTGRSELADEEVQKAAELAKSSQN
jgi:tetratricopeptide (TPR) repeat protein